jgi:outer membrane murein-binding lipoprotein Lpp
MTFIKKSFTGDYKMKNMMIFAAMAALTILSGCSETAKSTSSESDDVLKLKTEKAQIVQELESTRNELDAEIKQKDQKIAQLEEEKALLEKQVTGFEGIINQMIGKYQEISEDVKATKEENKQLKAELAELKAPKPPVTSSQELDSNAEKRLDALKSLKKDDSAQ